jgi:hypothetical protein
MITCSRDFANPAHPSSASPRHPFQLNASPPIVLLHVLPVLELMAHDLVTANGAIPKTPATGSNKHRTKNKAPVDPNVLEVVFGSLLIKPWYPSFYPEELVGRRIERLNVCQWCFKYTKELLPFLGHLVRLPPACCSLRGTAYYLRQAHNRRKLVPSALPLHLAAPSTHNAT